MYCGYRFFNKAKSDVQLFFLNTKMSKSKKCNTDQKQKGSAKKKPMTELDEKGSIYLDTKGEIILKIHAKPGAKESRITDVGNESVGIQISAPPVDGEANKELIRYFAEVLNLKKSEVILQKGSRSKEKTVAISGTSITLDDVINKIKEASKQ